MKLFLIILSVIGLGLTIVPSILVFLKDISMDSHKQYMFFGMILWFTTAPFWIKRKEAVARKEIT